MKKFIHTFTGTLLAGALVLTPLTGFAANQSDKSWSGWSKVSQWFNGQTKKAYAQQEQKNKNPVVSGITAPTVLKTGQMGTWKIKASDPENGSLSYAVNWGDTSNGLAKIAALPSFVQTSTFTHSYAAPGTYTVEFIVMDEAGLKNTTTVTVHVTGQAVTLPVISDVVATSTKPKQAVLTWKTDVKSNSSVWYSTTSPVNTTATPNVFKTGKVENHKITLTKLEPGTTYYAVVGSANSNGTTTSGEVSFTTPSDVSSAPVITSVEGQTPIEVGDTETVTVKAFDPKNSPLEYSVDWGDNGTLRRMLASEPIFEQTSTFTHVYDAAGTYTATFTVRNEAGLQATSSLTITVNEATPVPDTTGPVLSQIDTNVSSSSAAVSWTTDEPATSKVFYSLTTPIDTTIAQFVASSTLETEHSIEVPNLLSNTLHYFIIQSVDSSGNITNSTEQTFTTTE